MEFEEQLQQTIRNKIISEVADTKFTRLGNYKEVPPEVVSKVWDSIDWDEIIEEIRPKIQTRICNAIIGSMETEVKTDIKKVLAVEGVRQKLRMEIYPKLLKVLDGEDN